MPSRKERGDLLIIMINICCFGPTDLDKLRSLGTEIAKKFVEEENSYFKINLKKSKEISNTMI